MKQLFAKRWFQILIFGAVIGGILIVLDEKTGLFGSEKKPAGNYNGPVSIDKNKTYFTEIGLSETVHDFGKVKEGDTLSHIFKVTNKGSEPLFIYKTVGSCDCVGSVVTKDMIAPGKEADLKTYFNTKGRKGIQNRSIVVTCNTDPADITLTLKADVE
jgi:Protein of unknown function (DUF1573)